MAKKLPTLRVAGPTILVSLLLFAACTFAAVVLYRWHARTAQHLTEDLDSRKLAEKIETQLRNLKNLVARGNNDLDDLHAEITELLDNARPLLNTPTEEAMGQDLEDSFQTYHDLWQEHGGGPSSRALAHLEKDTLPLANRVRTHHVQAIGQSEEALRSTVRWIAWGLVAVGVIGSLGGIFLGYGVARTIRHSFYKLSVSLRDATDKLRHELPTVTLRASEGMDYLHEQMTHLMREVEQTVERLQQREHEVLRAEQLAAVGQLAAGVAHELRNPLTAVKMLVQTSREDMETRGLPAEDLHIIEKEIRRLETSLQTFLDFARPPRMQRRCVQMEDIVEEALALTMGRARKQKVTVDFHRANDALELDADPEQLRQLLVNLILNALDSLQGSGHLILQASVANGQVELQVRDNGPGIKAELLPRLFEPFASGKETGLGLGLVVSRRIAEAHGGSLEGRNLDQGGACFTLRLPLGESTPAASGALAQSRA